MVTDCGQGVGLVLHDEHRRARSALPSVSIINGLAEGEVAVAAHELVAVVGVEVRRVVPVEGNADFEAQVYLVGVGACPGAVGVDVGRCSESVLLH